MKNLIRFIAICLASFFFLTAFASSQKEGRQNSACAKNIKETHHITTQNMKCVFQKDIVFLENEKTDCSEEIAFSPFVNQSYFYNYITFHSNEKSIVLPSYGSFNLSLMQFRAKYLLYNSLKVPLA